ncbi:hypothetical protein [Pelagovum sp. HNIBRBA483]|uniref:hypothetical protein n=1 Tax=Pelagovum sp. HNIBRBA483 TaxID=3233341 RepID=UPI0034A285A3
MKPFSRHLIATLGVSAMALLPATGGVFLLSADQAFAQGKGNSGNNGNRGGGNRSDRADERGNKGNNGNNGNGNGRGNGNQPSASQQSVDGDEGSEDEGKPGRGAIASELKGLNAAHANINALMNASPNSQVGRIASYYFAVNATDDLLADIAAAEGYFDAETLESIAAYEDAIAALDPESPTYDAELEALTNSLNKVYEDLITDLDAEIAALDTDGDGIADDPTNDQALADLQAELNAVTTYRDAETLLAEAEAAEGDSYNNLVSDTLSEEAWAEFLSLLGLDPETEQPEIAIEETTEGDGEATE